ncbi:TetR/AcrR family transcriptional regulator [Vitiosangium sp. GDMCC 1.1324]|uniref:TetR/AcrR family transcriptional regulator n=1 Tax=Vitiosangium sp. (strain GDMCC 1.1324) TaxID=2138576 RepID=UPI000D3ACB03|nr:TetR/AcrR family transcriptional regulator [Vitiosangium sp. GDMCC 1.1324]PTL79672.1 TetR family transcriptional regulator [Vitiosangium sp. GDMCC 1.1324]
MRRASPPRVDVTPPREVAEIRRRRRTQGLSREDWADAALWSLREGVEALSVEALARRLGVTKGSFYWHFRDRSELLQAALERWEQLATENIIAKVEAIEQPRERLRALLITAFNEDPGQKVEVALAASVDHPLLKPVLARVSRRRIEYLVSLYQALGMPAAEARCWGLHAYSTFSGLLHLVHSAPEALPSGKGRARYVEHLMRTLVPGS